MSDDRDDSNPRGLRLLRGVQWTSGSRAQLPDSRESRDLESAKRERRRQISLLRRAGAALGYQLGFGAPNEEELRDAIAQLQEAAFQLDLELQALEASESMRFPTASEIADLGAAADELEARIASSAAANAIMEAAGQVIVAFGL